MTAEARRVVDALGLSLEWTELPWGSAWYHEHGTMMPLDALDVALGKSQRETLGEPLTRNVAAYDAYLKGEELLKSGVDIATLRRAVAEYEEALLKC